jgi:hypothetical protein
MFMVYCGLAGVVADWCGGYYLLTNQISVPLYEVGLKKSVRVTAHYTYIVTKVIIQISN